MKLISKIVQILYVISLFIILSFSFLLFLIYLETGMINNYILVGMAICGFIFSLLSLIENKFNSLDSQIMSNDIKEIKEKLDKLINQANN